MASWWPFGRRGEEKRSFLIVRSEDTVSARQFQGPVIAPWSERQAAFNSVVSAGLAWSAANITEPPVRVGVETENGFEPMPSAAFDRFLASPMASESYRYSMTENRMRQIWGLSLVLDGNAYGVILRNDRGAPVGVMPVYHVYIGPKLSSDRQRIEAYRYGNQELPPEDVIHMRMGVDPDAPCMGRSGLKSAMRQILTDNEIAAYQHRVVESPTPGLAVLIDDSQSFLTEEQNQEIKQRIDAELGGERRGRPAVLQGVKLERVGFSPQDLDIAAMARYPEERICAAMGLPPSVVGVGAGLDRSTFNNYETALKAAVSNHLDPLWVEIEKALTKVLHMLDPLAAGRVVQYDRSVVRAYQQDEDELAARVDKLFRANIVDRATAKAMLGMKPGEDDREVYFWQLSPQFGGVLPMTEGLSARDRVRVNVH